eukprot:scaffold16412_cov59-Phaeocystis_antarctica.AAC.10
MTASSTQEQHSRLRMLRSGQHPSAAMLAAVTWLQRYRSTTRRAGHWAATACIPCSSWLQPRRLSSSSSWQPGPCCVRARVACTRRGWTGSSSACTRWTPANWSSWAISFIGFASCTRFIGFAQSRRSCGQPSKLCSTSSVMSTSLRVST